MKANKTTEGWKYQSTREGKTRNQRVALIQLHTNPYTTKSTKWQKLPHTYKY
jgi:hypothetical protein